MSTLGRHPQRARIVRATPEDAYVVAALSLQFAIAMEDVREDGYIDRAADHWLRHHEQLPTWIAQREGSHAGYLQATHPPETTWPGQPSGTRGRLWINAMYVHPDHRRRGVGTALLRACERWAKGVGVAVVRLRCAIDADGFYTATGYEPATELREKRLGR